MSWPFMQSLVGWHKSCFRGVGQWACSGGRALPRVEGWAGAGWGRAVQEWELGAGPEIQLAEGGWWRFSLGVVSTFQFSVACSPLLLHYTHPPPISTHPSRPGPGPAAADPLRCRALQPGAGDEGARDLRGRQGGAAIGQVRPGAWGRGSTSLKPLSWAGGTADAARKGRSSCPSQGRCQAILGVQACDAAWPELSLGVLHHCSGPAASVSFSTASLFLAGFEAFCTCNNAVCRAAKRE